jgi:hypothetical protein
MMSQEDPARRIAGGPVRTFGDVRARAAAAALTGNDNEILALADEVGAAHGREPQYRLPRDDIPAAFGISEAGNLAYMVMAVYQDSCDIARAEADPQYGRRNWSELPISPGHKAWLRSNLVTHADLAGMLQVPVQRIYREAGTAGWPGPVIDRPRQHWHWWPHLERPLASRGLALPPDITPPALGPAPNWWRHLLTDPQFAEYLGENLVDFAGCAATFDLDRATILRAGRRPDYPEPVIGRQGNHWYWLADLDRFLVRHRDDPSFGADPSWPTTAREGIQAADASPAAAARRPGRSRPQGRPRTRSR